MSLVEIKGLQVSFRQHGGEVEAVRGVDLSLRDGESLGIVGESGSGKSVTCLALMRLLASTATVKADRLVLNGVDVLKAKNRQMASIRGSAAAMIFQDPATAFDPVFTIGHQMAETIITHRRVSKAAALAEAEQLLLKVEIKNARDVLGYYPHQLSGGMLQRAMIAMALSCKPRLLIADEPTTAIDVTTQAQVLALLRDLQARYNTAIIFITHDLGVIAQMASYVVVMYLGRVMEEGPVDEIFHAPKHPYTKALLRSIPSLYGETRVALPVIAGALPHPFNRPPGCPFHPRCPDAMARCSAAVPSLQPVAANQLASCFLHHDIAEPS
jgi:oligopeptide/dipeptide ABC transporter ATP-binding protein